MSIKEINKKLKETQNITLRKISNIRLLISDIEDVKYFCCKEKNIDYNMDGLNLSFNINNEYLNNFVNVLKQRRSQVKINKIDRKDKFSIIYVDY